MSTANEGTNPFRLHLEKFTTLSEGDFQKALKYFTPKTLKKKEYLIRQGDAVTSTYWVKSGLLLSIFVDDNGKEHIIQFAIENCWITDQNAFYNQDRAILNIVAHEDTDLLSISYDDREKLCRDIPAMALFFLKKANDSFVKQQSRLLTYLTLDAKKRFQLLHREYPGLFQRIPKKTIAAYLGVSGETLSRFRHD